MDCEAQGGASVQSAVSSTPVGCHMRSCVLVMAVQLALISRPSLVFKNFAATCACFA